MHTHTCIYVYVNGHSLMARYLILEAINIQLEIQRLIYYATLIFGFFNDFSQQKKVNEMYKFK